MASDGPKEFEKRQQDKANAEDPPEWLLRWYSSNALMAGKGASNQVAMHV